MPCPYSEVFSDFPEVAVTWTHNTFRSYCALLRFLPTTFIETAEDKCQYRTLISVLVLYKRPIHDITSKIRRQYSPHDYRLKIDRSIDRSLTNHTFKQERIMFRSTEREFQLTIKFNWRLNSMSSLRLSKRELKATSNIHFLVKLSCRLYS